MTEIELHSTLSLNNEPLVFRWEDIRYSAAKQKEGEKVKKILKGISGEVKAGEMLAILGPSGKLDLILNLKDLKALVRHLCWIFLLKDWLIPPLLK